MLGALFRHFRLFRGFKSVQGAQQVPGMTWQIINCLVSLQHASSVGDTDLRPLKSRFLVEMAIKIDYKCPFKRGLAHVASDIGPYNATDTSNSAWKALEILTFRGRLSYFRPEVAFVKL